MAHEQLIEAQMVLGKMAVDFILELLKSDGVKAVEQKFGFLEGDSNNAINRFNSFNSWKTT